MCVYADGIAMRPRGVRANTIFKVGEGRPNIVDALISGEIDAFDWALREREGPDKISRIRILDHLTEVSCDVCVPLCIERHAVSAGGDSERAIRWVVVDIRFQRENRRTLKRDVQSAGWIETHARWIERWRRGR